MAQKSGLSSLIPLPVMVFLAVAVLGTISGVLIVMRAYTALAVVLVGFLFVGLLLFGYTKVMDLLSKSKSQPFEKQIRENAGKGRKGLAGEASVEDLQNKFAEGLDVFRKHGKDIYSLPWYLLVGEPGSGKTEAVRHSNVGFPAGLQNTLQGLGGTMNMNWWFTNYAVILDTAGRLMFDQAATGKTGEWKEFLKLLKSARPNSPINGLLLVIPADSLVKDNEATIREKATRIAQQLDSVRETLKVRFPAFVIVTKSDLINGFREFYDSIDDPTLQHQMVGWSNPQELDDPFDPRYLGQHFSSLTDRIKRRRLALLMDPVHTEDPNLRRIDQVDALYAYPEVMSGLVPKLQQYLEIIFDSGTWKDEPLFFRGIYFTSSMREGDSLDADLAAAIGVPVDALPEGRSWKRERSFFLRDLFIKKVFVERGLVVRSKSAKAARAAAKALVLGSAGFAAVALIGLTALGAYSFYSSIGQHLTFWQGVNTAYVVNPEASGALDRQIAQARDIVYQTDNNEPNYAYLGAEVMDVGAKSFEREEVAPVLLAELEKPIEAPLLYRPLAPIAADFDAERASAFEALFVGTVIAPVVNAASERMELDTRWTGDASAWVGPWTDAKFDALVSLIHVEVRAVNQETGRPMFDFDALLRYVISPLETSGTAPEVNVEALRKGFDHLVGEGRLTIEDVRSLSRDLKSGIQMGTRALLNSIDDVGDSREAMEKAFGQGTAIVDAFDAAADTTNTPRWIREDKASLSNRLRELQRRLEALDG